MCLFTLHNDDVYVCYAEFICIQYDIYKIILLCALCMTVCWRRDEIKMETKFDTKKNFQMWMEKCTHKWKLSAITMNAADIFWMIYCNLNMDFIFDCVLGSNDVIYNEITCVIGCVDRGTCSTRNYRYLHLFYLCLFRQLFLHFTGQANIIESHLNPNSIAMWESWKSESRIRMLSSRVLNAKHFFAWMCLMSTSSARFWHTIDATPSRWISWSHREVFRKINCFDFAFLFYFF